MIERCVQLAVLMLLGAAVSGLWFTHDLEVVSQPFQHSVQAAELNEREEQVGMELVASGDAAKVAEPADAALDSVAAFVAPQRAAILRSGARTVLAVRGDEFDALRFQSLSQRITVGGPIVDEPLRLESPYWRRGRSVYLCRSNNPGSVCDSSLRGTWVSVRRPAGRRFY